MKKEKGYRVIFYLAGLLILAFGITLNTKTGLGVSPIISVSFSISTILDVNFGDMTFLWYAIFVLIEVLLHTVMSKRSGRSGKVRVTDLKKAVAADVLQIPLCLMFTRFMNLFSVLRRDICWKFCWEAFASYSCDHSYRSRSGLVAGYEDCPESGRWDRTGVE